MNVSLKWLLTLACLALTSPPSQAHTQTDPTPHAVATQLLELREAAGLSVSPSGRLVAYEVRRAVAATNRYEAWWEILRLDGVSAPRRVADGGDPPWGRLARNDRPTMVWITLSARWSPDERWIAYLKNSDGAIQIWRSRVDGSRTEQVTNDPGDVIDFVWSSDGRSVVYSAGPPRAARARALAEERLDGFLVDDRFDPLVSWEPVRVHGQQAPGCCRVQRIGSGQARTATTDEIEHYRLSRPFPAYWSVTGTMHMWTARSQGEPPPRLTPTPGQPALARWERRAEDGSSILLAFADPALQGIRAPARLYAQSDAGSDYVACTQPECVGLMNDAWRTSDGDVVFSRNEGYRHSSTGFYSWRPGEQTVRLLLQTADILSDCTQAGDRLICFREGTLTPQTLIAMDLETGATTTLVDLNSNYDVAAQATAERVEWRSPSGAPVFGYFVRPLIGHAPYPTVIVQYRARGFLRGGSGDFSPVQAYARAGLATFVVDRPEDEDAWARNDDDDRRESESWRGLRERRDVYGALDHGIDTLVRRGDVDAERIGISGFSDGAVTAAFAIIQSRRYRAASISAGTWEPISYYMASPEARAFMSELGIGLPGSNSDQNWDGLSLSRNAQSIDTPLLIQTADREFGNSLQPLVTLQEYNKPVEAYVFSDEYHAIWQPRHRLAMYRRNIDWFRFWLQDYEDPDPSKQQQYQRWRAMRDATPPPP